MSSAASIRVFTSRLSLVPSTLRHAQKNHHTRFSSRSFSSFSSSHVTAPPRRSLSLNARHVQSEPDVFSAASFSQLSFPELVARTSSFLVDYYEAPTASPLVAAQLLTALQQYNVAGPQLQLKERLEGELDELVNEGKRRERRLGDDRPLDKDDTDSEHTDDILRITYIEAEADANEDDDGEVLEQRIIARPPLLPPPHFQDMDLHFDTAGSGGVARGKFDSGYSTDQLLVDSLPTLKEEEAVQLGRRDVMKLMGTRN